MTVDNVIPVVFSLYQQFNIRSFPINVYDILRQAGFDTRRYSHLSDRQREKCMLMSHDACTIKDTIYYNDFHNSEKRIRFTLMHELGHIVLNSQSEDDADLFASTFLAPPHMIQNRFLDADDVSEYFGISTVASNRALYNSKLWLSLSKKSDIDLQIMNWFKIVHQERG